MSTTDTNLVALASNPACAITHLCAFLAKRGLRLADRANYTESLPTPSTDAAVILGAVSACGDAHLTIIDADRAKVGWAYLILPPAVGADESVADYSDNALLEEWSQEFDRVRA